MKLFLKLIENWEKLEKIAVDEEVKATCQQAIKELKRKNFLIDCLDILFRAWGILLVIAGFLLFWSMLQDGSLFALINLITIYYGYKIAKGLDK